MKNESVDIVVKIPEDKYHDSTRSLGRGFATVITTAALLFLIVYKVHGCGSHKNTTQPTSPTSNSEVEIAAGKTYYFTVTTQWLEIPTGGRRFKAQLQSVNGIKLRHEISVNDKHHPQKVTRDMKIGAHWKIQRIFYKLEPDQEFEKALLEFTFY